MWLLFFLRLIEDGLIHSVAVTEKVKIYDYCLQILIMRAIKPAWRRENEEKKRKERSLCTKSGGGRATV